MAAGKYIFARLLLETTKIAKFYFKLKKQQEHLIVPVYRKTLVECIYEGFGWCHRESNQGHKDFQSFALPTEL